MQPATSTSTATGIGTSTGTGTGTTAAQAPDHARVDAELRVSTLELFFDLVFVFTITQLTSLLARELGPTAAAQVVGVTSLAAGVKLTISTIDARLPLGPAFLLAGGVALYLLGDTLFRRAMRIPRGAYRVGAALVALATVALGTSVAGLAQLAGLLATLVVMLALEARRRPAGA